MTPTQQTFKRLLSYWPLALICVGVAGLFLNLLFCLWIVVGGYYTLKDTKGFVQGVGPVYWITRDDPRVVGAGLGTMHELSAPWRKGRGLYIVCAKRSLQIGLCRKQNLDETEGTLSAVQGRYMDTPPTEIGNW